MDDRPKPLVDLMEALRASIGRESDPQAEDETVQALGAYRKARALEAVTESTRGVVEASAAAHEAMRLRARRRREALELGATPEEVSAAILAGHPTGMKLR